MALTDLFIRKIKPVEKVTKFTDAHGLYLEVTPAGGKSWKLKYRFQGKEKKLAIGTYPQVSLLDARHAAMEAKKMLVDGVDPSQQRKTSRLSSLRTFQNVAMEWFEKTSPQYSEDHAAKVLSRMEKKLFPTLGSMEITEISPQDVLLVCRRFEKQISAFVARTLLGLVSRIFRYAVACGYVLSDPSRDLRGALSVHKEKHHPTITDPAGVGNLVRRIYDYEGAPVTKAALQLLLLCMCRTQELRGMRWDEIDEKNNLWRIPAERMKMRQDHLVPLSRQSKAILDELRLISGDVPLVFPSTCVQRRKDTPLGKNTINNALRTMGYSKDEIVGHGFRATASTLLNEVGWAPDVIEAQLAHAPLDKVRAAYNRAAYLDDRRKMMQAWADLLDELRTNAG